MHYKNGREAKNGDNVLNLTSGRSGVLHSTSAQSTTCNGRLATLSDNDAYVTISDCLHIEDIAVSAPNLIDVSKPAMSAPTAEPAVTTESGVGAAPSAN